MNTYLIYWHRDYLHSLTVTYHHLDSNATRSKVIHETLHSDKHNHNNVNNVKTIDTVTRVFYIDRYFIWLPPEPWRPVTYNEKTVHNLNIGLQLV